MLGTRKILRRSLAILIICTLAAQTLPPGAALPTNYLLGAAAPASASTGTTIRVSLSASGEQGDQLSLHVSPALSADGRFIAFYSSASNLVPGDTNGSFDIFVRDLSSGAVELISVSSGGDQGNGHSVTPTISRSGRYVAFVSGASNLVTGDTNGARDVFVRDRSTGTTTRASLTSTGGQSPSHTDDAVISDDGRYVAFTTLGAFVPGDIEGSWADVYVRDMVAGMTTLASAGTTGQPSNGDVFRDSSVNVAMSGDGRFVAFPSDASNLVSDDTNGRTDVFLRDLVAGTTVRVSLSAEGLQANGNSYDPTITRDGRFIAFASSASNLVAGDDDVTTNVFVRDMGLNTITRIPVRIGNARSAITDDGAYLAFATTTVLTPEDTNGLADVYLYEVATGAAVRVSMNSSGAQANADSGQPSIAGGDARLIAFASTASNLVDNDTNGTSDVFLSNRRPAVDFGSDKAYTFGFDPNGGYSKDPVNLATGVFTAQAEDLVLPGRVLGLAFGRSYNSADTTTGPLGPAWTHTYNWRVSDAEATVEVRRGDGRRDTFTRNPDGTYANPPNVFDALTKNADASYTLTLTNQVRYEFSGAGQLTRIHEPAGNAITLAYTSGNLTTITDTVGRTVALSYDAANRLTQLQDPLGRRVTYSYDGSGRLASVVDKIGNAPGEDPAAHRWQYAYDGTTQHLTTIADPDGRIRVTNTYDTQGRVFEQRDALGALTTMTYGTLQTTVTDPRGHQSTYTFDSRMRVLTQTDVVGARTYTLTYVYDAQGNRTSITDRNGESTDLTYDTRGNLLTKTDPAPAVGEPRPVTTFEYDAKNNLSRIVDARGFASEMAHEPTTNVLLSVRRQVDATTWAVTTYEYGDAANPGLPTRIVSPRGNTGATPDPTYATFLTYDAQANLTARTDPDAARTTFGYDAAGRLVSFADPDGNAPGGVPAEHTWTIGYDQNDRETSRTDPLGHVLRYAYDGAGDRTALTDRNGNVTTYAYDANARLAAVEQKPDSAGQPMLVYRTNVTRDGNGNATRITQANGAATDYAFDPLDRLVSVTTHPDASTALVTSYVLDGNGQPTSRTTGDGVTVSYAYDALSRLTSVTGPSLSITYAYDAAGSRTRMVDATGTTTYQYDGLGRVTQVAAPGGILSYAYDLDGNRTTLGYPGGDSVTYEFSPGGRMTTVTDWATRISRYTYQASGLVASLDHPNGLRATYAYDRAQRLTQITNAVGPTTITQHVYGLDPEGNRTTLDEYLQGITPPPIVWSDSNRVNDDAGTTQQDRPSIALGTDGATYLVWDDFRSGSHADIYFSRRDPTTGAWSASQKVNDDATTRTQFNAALAVDGSNNAYAVWQDQRDGNKTPDTNIYAAKRSTSTGTWGSNARVNDDTKAVTQRDPRIAVQSDGAATAVWIDFRSNQWNVYSARLAAGATSWSANLRVTDNTSARKELPDVAVAPDGTAHAVWDDDRNGNFDVFHATLAPGATAWSVNRKVSDDAGAAAQYYARIGVDGTGNIVIIWLDDRDATTTVRMSRLPAGSSTWEASRVISDAAAIPVATAIGVRSDGNAFAAWQDARGTSYDVWGSDYSASSNSWSAAALVSDDPASTAQLRPTAALNHTEVAVAWRDDRGGNADIRARRRAPQGQGVDHFTYAYDGLNRLTDVSGAAAESFTFDTATNIASRSGPDATYTHDLANRVTSDGTRSFVWDGADRLVRRGADTFAYDALSRLTSATVAGATTSYTYDGDGLLAARTRTAGITNLIWDTSMAPAPLLEAGTDRVVYGLGPLYLARADGSTIRLVGDALSSVRAEVDDLGLVTKSFRYAAYGAISDHSPLDATPTLLAFAGELTDPSNLVYLRARWYEPAMGRFMAKDPFGGLATTPGSLNSYSYVIGRPTLLVDPLGLFPGESGSNWAYTIADVFADLDSTDPFKRTYAQAMVGVSGFAIAGLLVAVGVVAAPVAPAAVRLWPAASAGPAVINGITYTTHALEAMSPRGLIQRGREIVSMGVPPSVVENAVEFGRKLPGSATGTVRHVFDNVVVVTNEAASRVITVWTTGR